MKRVLLLIFIAIFLLADLTFAQSGPNFSAQIRPRFNVDNRDFNSNTKMNSFTEMRTRLGVKYSPLANLTGFIQIQDSRIFGTEPNTLANTQNLDVHQAYFQIDKLFDLPVALKIGRMEAAYGTERLIGAVGWSNVGRSFDGLTLKFNFTKVKFDLFAFREVETGNADDSLDQNVIGLYSYIDFFEGHSLQPFAIYYTSSAASYPFNTLTLGANLIGDIEGFHHEAEFAYQTGSQINDGPTDVKAMLAAYNASYTFNATVKPMIGGGIDFLSGDDGATANEYKAFNTLFATNHKYYGYMDYFLNIPANTYALGLMDIHGKIGLQPTENFAVKAIFHLFNSAEDAALSDGSPTNNFGSEVDIILNFKYNANVGFELGGTFFSPGEIFKEIKGSDTSTWFYLMAVVNL